MTDDQLREEVLSHLHGDDRLATAELAVDVDAHRVELQGVVPTYLAQKAAVEDAMDVEGVISVLDKTEIQYPAGVARPNDAEIREMVEVMLHLNPNIDSQGIDVEVKNGVVTLKGVVDAYWKKIRAEELILDSLHVLALTNHLSVEPRHHYQDEEIARGILKAFERVAEIDQSRVAVAVNRGVVLLDGVVTRGAVMHTIIRLAQNTRGVRDVINRILVESANQNE